MKSYLKTTIVSILYISTNAVHAEGQWLNCPLANPKVTWHQYFNYIVEPRQTDGSFKPTKAQFAFATVKFDKHVGSRPWLIHNLNPNQCYFQHSYRGGTWGSATTEWKGNDVELRSHKKNLHANTHDFEININGKIFHYDNFGRILGTNGTPVGRMYCHTIARSKKNPHPCSTGIGISENNAEYLKASEKKTKLFNYFWYELSSIARGRPIESKEELARILYLAMPAIIEPGTIISRSNHSLTYNNLSAGQKNLMRLLERKLTAGIMSQALSEGLTFEQDTQHRIETSNRILYERDYTDEYHVDEASDDHFYTSYDHEIVMSSQIKNKKTETKMPFSLIQRFSPIEDHAPVVDIAVGDYYGDDWYYLSSELLRVLESRDVWNDLSVGALKKRLEGDILELQ